MNMLADAQYPGCVDGVARRGSRPDMVRARQPVRRTR